MFPINWERLRAIVCVFSAHLRRVLKSTCVCLRLLEQCLRSEITSVSRVANVLLLRLDGREYAGVQTFPVDRNRCDCSKARRNPQKVDLCMLASFSCRVYAETQGRSFDLWPPLPATKRKSRTFATRETDVISERKHCSRRRRHTQVELSSSRKCADKTQTIARKRWHGARKRKRSNVRSTCGRL